jgi:hypothetical protein
MKNILKITFALIILSGISSCKLDVCKSVNCQNNGFCEQGFCKCPEGFQGDECEIETEFLIISLPQNVIVEIEETKSVLLDYSIIPEDFGQVSISVEDLPAGVSVQLLTNPSGKTTNAIFYASQQASPGIFNCNFIATSVNGKIKKSAFKLTITSCINELLGSFNVSETSNSGNSFNYFSANITTNANGNKMIIDKLFYVGPIYAYAKCSKYEIFIPEQSINGRTFFGDGYFDFYRSNYVINYNVIDDATMGLNLNKNCTAYFERK